MDGAGQAVTRRRYEITIGASDAPVLEAFMACRAPVSVIRGPLGSGKTFGVCQRLLAQMCEQKPNEQGVRVSRWLAVRNTYLDLTETTIKDFLAVFEGLGRMKYGGLQPPGFTAGWQLEDGTRVQAEVIFLALDRDAHVRKLKGYQVTGVWFNEMSEIPKSLVDMADLRHGRYPSEASGGVRCTWHGMLGDTNSFDRDHWMFGLEERPPEGWRFFVQPGGVIDTGEMDPVGRRIFRANPDAENLSNLPDAYYSRGLQGKDEAWIRVMLANEFGFFVTGKPVHPSYIDSVHCAREPLAGNPDWPIVLGQDFGRTPATAFLQFHPQLGRWLCIDEMTSDGMSASVYGPELKRKLDREYPGYRVSAWGDPAGDHSGQTVETTPIQLLRAAGIPIQPAPSNVWALRTAALDTCLTRLCMDGRPGFLLSPKCRAIRKGLMGGYHYRQLQVSGPEPRYASEPEKNASSHPCEALHYALLGGGEGRAALVPAEHVRASRGPVQTSAGWDDGDSAW